MIYHRRTGVLSLHGVAVALIVPAFFALYWFYYARLGPGLVLVNSNQDLYVVGLLLTSLTFFGLYGRLSYQRLWKFQASMEVAGLQVLGLGFALFAIAFVSQEKTISRFFVLSFLGATWVLLSLLNYYLPKLLGEYIVAKGHSLNTMLVGSSHAAQKLWGWLKSQESIGVNVLGLVTEDEEDKGLLGVEHLGKAWELSDLFKRYSVDQVILLESMMSPERLRNVFSLCQRQGVRVLIYSYWEDLLNYPLVAVSEGGATFFALGTEPLENPVNRFLKRTLDLLVSIPVCLLLLPPLMLYVRHRLRKESPGPMFFKQLRAGRNGKQFTVLKFRTMHVREGDANDTKQAQKVDPRVFTFGQWMRRTSVDELPQFINVFWGQMSTVGPRPHMLAHDAQFAEYVELYRSRHFVKPGITGLAQVNGYRGEISELELLEKRVRFDIEYITHWSLWMDIVIILKTAVFLVKPQSSAY